MSKINYQKELDRVIEGLQQKGKVPKLLLHVCCAPCSSYCLEYLSQYFDITVYYYNPNISKKEEYEYRLSEEKRFISIKEFKYPVKLTDSEYCPEDFFRAVKGFENEPEGGLRCRECFKLRLEATAKKAGAEMAERYGVSWLYSDFKKKEGYKRSIELSREYQLYRQNYCGCVFSKREAESKQVQTDLSDK